MESWPTLAIAKQNSTHSKISLSIQYEEDYKALSVIFFILITFYLQKSETLVDPSIHF